MELPTKTSCGGGGEGVFPRRPCAWDGNASSFDASSAPRSRQTQDTLFMAEHVQMTYILQPHFRKRLRLTYLYSAGTEPIMNCGSCVPTDYENENESVRGSLLLLSRSVIRFWKK